MRGAILLVPLFVIIALLVILARPRERTQQTVEVRNEVHKEITPTELRPFDPNTADYHTLVQAPGPPVFVRRSGHVYHWNSNQSYDNGPDTLEDFYYCRIILIS